MLSMSKFHVFLIRPYPRCLLPSPYPPYPPNLPSFQPRPRQEKMYELANLVFGHITNTQTQIKEKFTIVKSNAWQASSQHLDYFLAQLSYTQYKDLQLEVI